MDCARLKWIISHLMVTCAASLVASRVTLFRGHTDVDTIRVRFVGQPAAEGRMVPCSASPLGIPNHAPLYMAADMWEDGFSCGTCHVLSSKGAGPRLAYVAGSCEDCPKGSIALAERYSGARSTVEGTLTRTRCPTTGGEDASLDLVDQGLFSIIDFAPLGGEAGNVMGVKVASDQGWEHLEHAYAGMFQSYGLPANESFVFYVTDGFGAERGYACSRRDFDLICTPSASQSATSRKPLCAVPDPPQRFSTIVPIPPDSSIPPATFRFGLQSS